MAFLIAPPLRRGNRDLPATSDADGVGQSATHLRRFDDTPQQMLLVKLQSACDLRLRTKEKLGSRPQKLRVLRAI